MTYGLHMLAISGVNAVAGRMSDLLIGRILGLNALGLYSRASGLNGLLWDNVHIVLARIVFVDLASQHRDGRSLRQSYTRIVHMLTAILWPAFGGVAVIAGPLVLTLYGEKWIASALPLTMLSISAIILVSITMTWEVFVVCGETSRQARFEFIRTGVGLVLFAAGCFVGLTGAATGRVGEAVFSYILYRPHLERMTQAGRSDLMPIYAQSAILTVVAIGPAACVMTAYGWMPATPLYALLPAVLSGFVGWIACLRLYRHPLLDEASILLSRLKLRRASDSLNTALKG